MTGARLTRARLRLRGGALAAAVLVVVGAGWRLGAFERAEMALLDARFALRGPLAPRPDLVLVGIDEESASRYGRRVGAFSRSDFARVVDNLTAAGAELIVLDVMFSREDPDPNQDAALAAALAASGRVILVADVSDRNEAYPIPSLRAQEIGEGFVNLVRDLDGAVRRIPPPRLILDRGAGGEDAGAEAAGGLVLPLAVEAAVQRLHPEGPPEVEMQEGAYRIGRVAVRTTGAGTLVNFAGGPGAYPKIPLWRAVEGAIPEGAVRGKIVLVGSMHPLQHDHFPTPFRGTRSGPSVFRERTTVELGDMYGVEIHAHALDTILSGRALVAASRRGQAAAWLALGAASGLVFVVLRMKPWAGLGVAAAALLCLGAAAQAAFSVGGVVLDVVPGALILGGHFVAGLIFHRAVELRMKREIQGMFGRYVSPQVADLLIKDPSLVRLGGRKAVLTMFFSDIRGFTSLSETLPPDEVAALLQEYFTAMTRIVFKHGGTLDKFIGDAIMVFFGDPIPTADHAERAVWMALEMREAMERLKEKWRAEGRRTFDPGMGINSGEVVVGNTGSAERISYTVIGDNVNLAARLESNAGPGQILISAATRAAIPGVESKFIVEALPPIKVKGKAQPVEIYQVVGAR